MNNDESDKEDEKQKLKASENENPKTESKEEKGSHGTSEQKDKKKNILTWQHTSTKKEKGNGNKNLLSEKNGFTARPMMYHGGSNPSHLWPISAGPRGRYPPFSRPPMYGPYGGRGPMCGGGRPIQPYQYQFMARPLMFNGHMSPYPPMAPPFFPPYWQIRPFTDANPMTQYTSYADNYSFCFI
ncbi:unnamed protein product [Arabis nemorensis]|uniref:Uncharacterized protein n=1 Tax=Arabis nemorensis TaxID=586526 RepID=A0A565AKB0_9BRAS|nr:unnamed protein product [Arabis nemorensis]